MMQVGIEITDLRINMKAREWCKLPYPGHPKGCPNYGDPKHEGVCPPSAPLIHEFINTKLPIFLIVEEFNLALHVQKYKINHPNCTDKQAKCVLYWQNSVRSKLRKQCEIFRHLHPDFIITLCPEAMGVNVIATAQIAKVPIKVKPEDIVYKIALAGVPNEKGNNSRTDELLSTQLPLLF